MKILLALLFLLGAGVMAEEDTRKYEVWITGEPLSQGPWILFRTDKSVQGNTRDNLVLLGATRDCAKVFGPAFVKAAQEHKKLRLYGILLPVPAEQQKPDLPNVQFITWKLHLPEDPDELPADQKITIGPKDSIPGSKVEISH